MEQITNIYRILSDETRLRILLVLYHKKLCVCQLQGVLGETQPKISKHLGKLRDLGMVSDERKEQYIFYYLGEENKMLREILETTAKHSKDNAKLQQDFERLYEADQYIQSSKNSAIK